MIEVAMVFDIHGTPIFWPSPKGSSGGSIPDNPNLWDIIWENRHTIGGICHTHPWEGPSSPSGTDVTTFAAIEAGLGKLLTWPIVTMTHIDYYLWRSGRYEHNFYPPFEETDDWFKAIEELRRLSQGE